MNLTQKISQMTPKGADLDATDLIEVSTIVGGSYVTKSITGQELIDAIPLPPTGLTVGTTPISSGTIGRVLFQGTGNVVQESANLFWDNTNNRLGINTSVPTNPLSIYRSGSTNYFNFEPSATGTAPYLQAVYQGVVDARIYFDSNSFKFRYAGSTLAYAIDCASITSNGNIVLTGSTEQKLHLFGSTNNYIQYTDAAAINIGVIGTADATSYIQVRTGNATNMSTGTLSTTFFNSGNVGIGGITTDAGFKLDVNGTARVQTSAYFATTSGSVGIGTSSPAQKLVVSNPSGGATTTFTNTTDADLQILLTSGVSLISPTTNTLAFGTTTTV
jgi:hypothetical protein